VRRRLLAIPLLALAALILSYLAAANLFLNTSWGRDKLRPRPEKLLIEWDRAWSWIPGVVEVRGLRIRGQNQVIQWELELDTATVPVSLGALAARRFSTAGARGTGLAFRMRRRLDRLPDPERERWTAEIAGLENPPAAAPETLYPRVQAASPWTVTLSDLQIEDVREVWLEEARLTGSGRLQGGLRFTPGGDFEMFESRLLSAESRVETGSGIVSDDLRLEVSALIEPFSPRGEGGAAVLRHVSGTLLAAGRVDSIAPLNALFRSAPWLHTEAAGALDAEVSLANGVLLPESRASVDAERLTILFAGYRATGSGPLRARIVAAEPTPHLEASFDLSDVEVRREDRDQNQTSGGRLLLTAESSELAIGNEPFADLETRLEISGATVDDLSVYNYYLPAAGGVEIVGGSGTLAGWLEASVAEKTARGAVTVEARRASVKIGDVALDGRLKLDTRLPRAWLVEQRYDLSGSVLELRDVTVREHDQLREGWWAKVRLADAELAYLEGVELRARLSAELRDSGPIVALVADKKRLAGLFRRFLTVEGVHASAQVRSAGAGMDLSGLEVTGEKLEILGDLHLAAAERSGLLFLRLGALSAAVELEGEERDWKLTRSRAWFEARRAARNRAPANGG
jgi:hypothetical protein